MGFHVGGFDADFSFVQVRSARVIGWVRGVGCGVETGRVDVRDCGVCAWCESEAEKWRMVEAMAEEVEVMDLVSEEEQE